MTAEDETPAPPAPAVILPPEPATLPPEAGAPTEEHGATSQIDPAGIESGFFGIEPAAPLTASERLKAHLRDVLAAQPFRGDAVHKDDVLILLDALIDGPPDA